MKKRTTKITKMCNYKNRFLTQNKIYFVRPDKNASPENQEITGF